MDSVGGAKWPGQVPQRLSIVRRHQTLSTVHLSVFECWRKKKLSDTIVSIWIYIVSFHWNIFYQSILATCMKNPFSMFNYILCKINDSISRFLGKQLRNKCSNAKYIPAKVESNYYTWKDSAKQHRAYWKWSLSAQNEYDSLWSACSWQFSARINAQWWIYRRKAVNSREMIKDHCVREIVTRIFV